MTSSGGLLIFGAGVIAKKIDPAATTSRIECDITRSFQVDSLLDTVKPDVVVNAAALTDSSRCEREPMVAYAVNALGAYNIARACKKRGIFSVHLSSDYCFDPKNRYSQSKLLGETCEFDLICRFNIYYNGSWFFRDIALGKKLELITFNKFAPVSLDNLVDSLEKLIVNRRTGSVWVRSSEICSYYTLMRKLAPQYKNIKPVNQNQVTGDIRYDKLPVNCVCENASWIQEIAETKVDKRYQIWKKF